MRKRKWVYIQNPTAYEISCDLCNGTDIAWSEYEHMIWCYKCNKDTRGNPGIFGGPIPLEACEIFGISMNKIDLSTGDILYMRVTKKGDKVIWRRKKPNA